MALQKYAFEVGRDHDGRRLDQFLARVLPAAPGVDSSGMSRRAVRRLIEAGAVWLDGRRVRVASRQVRPELRVEVWLGGEVSKVPAATFGTGRILFEDDWLIAVDKPAGTTSQATLNDAVGDLVSQLRRFLTGRDGRPPYLALHHRLDRGTSGVLLLARHRAANRGLAEAFAGRRVGKIYHALSAIAVPDPPREAWTVTNRLLTTTVDGAAGRRRTVADAAGKEAETEIRPVRWFRDAVHVQALPRTGRTHQVRVHLADAGLPVLGDALYGRTMSSRTMVSSRATVSSRAPRLMLHAASLALDHPVTGEPLVLESPLPEDFFDIVRRFEQIMEV